MANSLWRHRLYMDNIYGPHPFDCSLPGSSIHGIIQASILEWVVFPSPGDLPNPGMELRSPVLHMVSLPAEPQGKPKIIGMGSLSLLRRIFPGQKLTRLFCIAGGFLTNWAISTVQFSSVQFLRHVWLFMTPWIAPRQASLSITNSQSLLKLMSIESVMPSSHLILSHPLLLRPPILPSIRVFSNESALPFRWRMYWSFSFSISPCNEHPGLISFRMDWLDLLAVQGTLKSSPGPQFESIISSALSFLYSPTLTSIHGYWKNHSFD